HHSASRLSRPGADRREPEPGAHPVSCADLGGLCDAPAVDPRLLLAQSRVAWSPRLWRVHPELAEPDDRCARRYVRQLRDPLAESGEWSVSSAGRRADGRLSRGLSGNLRSRALAVLDEHRANPNVLADLPPQLSQSPSPKHD